MASHWDRSNRVNWYEVVRWQRAAVLHFGKPLYQLDGPARRAGSMAALYGGIRSGVALLAFDRSDKGNAFTMPSRHTADFTRDVLAIIDIARHIKPEVAYMTRNEATI